MNAEQLIKSHLDGKFFHYSPCKQRTIIRRVPRNFIPDHTAKFSIILETVGPRSRQWRREEDDRLVAMFGAGRSYKEMGEAIGVSLSAAIKRHREICLERGLSTDRHNLNQKYPDETCERVAYLKVVMKMTLAEIGGELCLTRDQVAGLWKRYKDKLDRAEAA